MKDKKNGISKIRNLSFNDLSLKPVKASLTTNIPQSPIYHNKLSLLPQFCPTASEIVLVYFPFSNYQNRNKSSQ